MSWLSSWPLKCIRSAARGQRADRFRQSDPHRADLRCEIHRSDIGALVRLRPTITLAIGEELRNLFGEIGQMDETAERRRESLFPNSHQSVERSVLKKRPVA